MLVIVDPGLSVPFIAHIVERSVTPTALAQVSHATFLSPFLARAGPVGLRRFLVSTLLGGGPCSTKKSQFITVEDVAGVRPWHLTPKVISVLRALTGTMKAHYVER